MTEQLQYFQQIKIIFLSQSNTHCCCLSVAVHAFVSTITTLYIAVQYMHVFVQV